MLPKYLRAPAISEAAPPTLPGLRSVSEAFPVPVEVSHSADQD